MGKRKRYQKTLALFLTFVMIVTTALSGIGNTMITANAVESKGSLATEVTGTTGSGATNASLLTNLPTKANAGKSRFTTTNYDANNGAVDTSNWGTGMLWDVDGSGEPYGYAVFAIPWSFKGSQEKQGLLFSKPSSKVVRDEKVGNGYVLGLAPSENDSEFAAIPGYATNGIKVDKITDWTYDIVMQKSDDTSTYMKTTMVQGSPFAYFEMVGTNTVTIERTRKQQSEIVKMAEDGSMFVIRVNDPVDQEFTTGNYYDYYAFYAPSGTIWTTEDTSNGAFKITAIKATFPQGKSYFSSAVLMEQKDMNDQAAISVAEAYKPYAYNFVTDTKAEYSYNEATHKLLTTYTYMIDKKDGSTADGTVMGILPHQYKNMSGNLSYLSNTFDSIRGTIKMATGSSFTTELTFSGILPWLTDVEDTDTLDGYVDEYMAQFFPNGVATSSSFTVAGTGDGADTYWTGKALNRTSNVLAAAESVGDTENAELLLESLKNELADWFTASGANDKKYFYYEKEIGSLLGFPESFTSVNEMNDHHFHYGYFIYTAAQVALRDPEWGQAYSGIIKELIYDIACPTRNNANSRYPYLRNFAPFEGHSWASGHANFNDGNNQESSSEAINAWAGIILFGEAMGDEELRDLGIYLYTTEISAINNYWFDVDEDVLADYYRYYGQYNHLSEQPPANAIPTFNQASMVWGGKYEYTTWFGANPMQVQGINLLPMNPSSFYLSLRSDYIVENWEVALAHVQEHNTAVANGTIEGNTWSQYVWNDVWSAYLALADTDKAIEFWQKGGAEEGESKAHTYQYIYSLKKAGKPDLTVTSNTTLSTCFVDAAGEKTYVAYNAGDTEKTVTFSDGKKVIVQPKTMETLAEEETQGDTQYTIQCYALALDAEGNETNQYEVIKTVTDRADKGANIEAEAPDISGYVFDETHPSNNLTGVVAEDGSLVLKAYYKKNTCTVTFNSNGGSAVEAKSVKIGKTVTKPVNPTKEGYEFGGWYNGTESFDFSTAITEDIVLVAQWKQLVPNTDKPARGEKGIERKDDDLIMYLKSDQASGVAFLKTVSSANESVSTAGVGAISSDLDPVVKSGEYLEYTIKNGANTYSGGYIAYWFNWDNSPTIVAISDIPNVGEYKAVDTTNHVVTFTSDGKTLSSQLVLDGEVVCKPTNPKKEGYTFAGWYLNGKEYNFGTAVTGDIVLTAQWTEKNENSDDVPETSTVKVTGIIINKKSIILESGQTETLLVTISPTEATNKEVKWLSDKPTVANVDATGKITALATGTATITVTTKDGGYTATCEVIVTAKADDNESGDDNNGGTNTNPDDNDSTNVVKEYKVTFDSEEGTAVDTQTVKEGEKAAKPENPTRAGYRFQGWYVGVTAYDFNSVVNADVTLTAKWEVIKITKIKITAISNKIAAGKKVQLKVSLSPTDAVAKSVTWELAKKTDSKYATVKADGKVTIKKRGAGKKVKVKVIVTGLDGTTKTKTLKITIKKDAVKKLAIKGKKTYSVKAGRSVSLKSKVKITTTGTSVNKTLKWTTSDETIATVSKSGTVKVSKTAKKGQKVTIKAQSTDGTNKKATFTIKVK